MNLLIGCIFLIINNSFNFLITLLKIKNINMVFLFNFTAISLKTRHLQGTTYRINNKMPNLYLLYFVKLNFILFLYSTFFYYDSNYYTNNSLNIINNLFLLYLPSYLEFSEFNGNRKSNGKNILIKIISTFFKLTNKYTTFFINDNITFDKDKQYLIGIHPHGLLPFGTIGCIFSGLDLDDKNIFSSYFKNNIYFGGASLCFYFPLMRDFYLLIGGIDCSKPILEKFINNNNSLILFLGGAEEAKFCNVKFSKIFIKSRKGYIKLAIENELTIVPCYCFGNNNIFKSFDFDILSIFYLFKKITGIWFPRGIPSITSIKSYTIIGKHILVEKKKLYTEEDLVVIQKLYINNLIEIFNKYKYLDESVKNNKLIIY